jgi:hypothetical protein
LHNKKTNHRESWKDENIVNNSSCSRNCQRWQNLSKPCLLLILIATDATTATDASNDGWSSTNGSNGCWHDANAWPTSTTYPHSTPDATNAAHSKFKHST